MSIEINIDNVKLASELAVSGETSVQEGYFMAVIEGVRSGVLSFDPSAADGKGQWKGNAAIVKACAEFGMPAQFKGLVSKACRVLAADQPNIKYVTPGEVYQLACEQVKVHGGVSRRYAELFPADDEGDKWVLAAAVATLFAAASKREVSVETVVAEVLAQAEGILKV